MHTDQHSKDYSRIAKAIRYLVDNQHGQPELADIASEIGLSDYHFQRLFSRWAGISPKKFLQYLTLQYAKDSLQRSAPVLDAAFDSGLSGPGRLHDLFINLQAVTPGEYKSKGQSLTFRYGAHLTRFGECLIVESDRGVTGLSFIGDAGIEDALQEQQAGWENADWVADSKAGIDTADKIFNTKNQGEPTRILARGTPYQVRVWEALLRIPAGATSTYGDMSEKVGCGRKAARAFGNACGANRIGLLIPCHRVIRETGVISGYRWGTERKRLVLAYEAAERNNTNDAAF